MYATICSAQHTLDLDAAAGARDECAGKPHAGPHSWRPSTSSPRNAGGSEQLASRPPACVVSKGTGADLTSSSRPSASDLSTRAAASLATDSIVNNCVDAATTLWCAGSQAASGAPGATAQVSPDVGAQPPASVEHTPSSLPQPNHIASAATASADGACMSPAGADHGALQPSSDQPTERGGLQQGAPLSGRPFPESHERAGRCTPRDLTQKLSKSFEGTAPHVQAQAGSAQPQPTENPDSAAAGAAELSPAAATRPRRSKQPWSKHEAWERELTGSQPADPAPDDAEPDATASAPQQRPKSAGRRATAAKRTPKRPTAQVHGNAEGAATDAQPVAPAQRKRRGGSARRKPKSAAAKRKPKKSRVEQKQLVAEPGSPAAQPQNDQQGGTSSDDDAASNASEASADDAPGVLWDRDHPHVGKASRAAKRMAAVFAGPLQGWEPGSGHQLLGGACVPAANDGCSQQHPQALVAEREQAHQEATAERARALQLALQQGDIMLAARYVGLTEALDMSGHAARASGGESAAVAATSDELAAQAQGVAGYIDDEAEDAAGDAHAGGAMPMVVPLSLLCSSLA